MRYLNLTTSAALTVAASLAVSAISAAPPAAAQPSTAAQAGQITLFVPYNGKTRVPALVTGSIGDHGTFVAINRNGTPDSNGNYAKLIMNRGSFELDGRAITHALQPIAGPNLNSCTITFAGTAPIRVFNGTGAYTGIHGTLRATGHAGLLGGRDANGRCDKHAAPVDILGSITATGTVAF